MSNTNKSNSVAATVSNITMSIEDSALNMRTTMTITDIIKLSSGDMQSHVATFPLIATTNATEVVSESSGMPTGTRNRVCTCAYKNEIASDELFALSDLSNDKNAVNSLAKIVQQLITKVGELENKIEQVQAENNSDI
jgi:hypothetical protein